MRYEEPNPGYLVIGYCRDPRLFAVVMPPPGWRVTHLLGLGEMAEGPLIMFMIRQASMFTDARSIIVGAGFGRQTFSAL